MLATFGTVPRRHGNAQFSIQFLKQFQRVIVLIVIDNPKLRPDFLVGRIAVFQKRLNAVFLQQRLVHSHATLIGIRVNSLHRPLLFRIIQGKETNSDLIRLPDPYLWIKSKGVANDFREIGVKRRLGGRCNRYGAQAIALSCWTLKRRLVFRKPQR